jgi:hypothetical protein
VDKIGLPLDIVLLLFLAWAIGRGQDYARLVLSAFFALSTLSMLFLVSQDAASVAPADMIASGVFWAIQLAAVILVFVPQSAPYYRPQPTERLSA